MSSSDGGFGGIDDEDLLLLASHAERRSVGSSVSDAGTSPYRASKRRRLNGPEVDFNDSTISPLGGRKCGRTEGQSEESTDSEDIGTPTTPSHIDATIHSKNKKDLPKDKLRSKYKIHIPKYADLPDNTFYTQVPPSSQSPYRMRGAYWQKPRPESPLEEMQSVGSERLTQNADITVPLHPTIQTNCQTTLAANFSRPEQNSSGAGAEASSFDAVNELADLSANAFLFRAGETGTIEEPIDISSQYQDSQQLYAQELRPSRLVGPQKNLKQTTLFGTQAQDDTRQSQSARKHNWPLANKEEPPTHHTLNQEALQSWVYPTNLGKTRDYQYNIVARALYHNLLVALPTGLGKTFIAATVMLNWFRWTKNAQIVFVAPTKPLCAQQVEACFNIAGIPRSETTLLTGNTPPGIRTEEWLSKRVFFMTPQTIINDLKTGIADPKKIVLLVVDEAHRATGSYAYVEVVKFLRRFNTSFRVLALTATPGASVEAVQEVIDGLGISRVEIRTEESIDIQQYVHSRTIDPVIFTYSDEMVMIMDLFAKSLQPSVNKLVGMNAYWGRDPMSLTPFGLTQARQKWMASDAGRKASMGVKGMVLTLSSLLASLAHAIELLKYHGVRPFFHKLTEFRSEMKGGDRGSKYKQEINNSEHFNKLMTRVGAWMNKEDFLGHPKLEYLQSVVLNHFLDAGDGKGATAGVPPHSTKIMVFVHYRDSAEEVARTLRRNAPMVRPHVFVGQANSKGSEGMDQKKQQDIINKFKDGTYNTLVATSIGEEGLDIGEVDLIVCYDASASPIRMLQRMGRTGRKRAGNIVVLLMKGKEEDNFTKAKDNYEKMQVMIASGTRFNFHEDLSPRIVPKGIQPAVDKKVIDIPLENTQSELPEPKKRKGKVPKRPPKKFHMPGGVRKGFTKASRLHEDDDRDEDEDKDEEDETENEYDRRPPKRGRPPKSESSIDLEPIPSLESVLLSATDQTRLERRYLDVGGETPQMVVAPRMDAFPGLQRTLRRTKHVRHGRPTQRLVGMLSAMHNMTDESAHQFSMHLHPEDQKDGEIQAEIRTAFFDGNMGRHQSSLGNFVSTLSVQASASFDPSPSHLEARPCTEVISSDDESVDNDDDHDRGGDDFIDDSAIINNGFSSASSPSLMGPSKLFYEPTKKVCLVDLGSEDDLPDLDTLVQLGDSRKALTESKQASSLADKDNRTDEPRPTYRRGKRLVVDSNGDDDDD
ncbi:3'-5' DNA helicase [Ptychographa xylographoides]|nr:3'-5' DNA helicase [Ptychographa xylographoides]